MINTESDCLIVIPCYNESIRLDQQAFIEFGASQPKVSILFVDDGSNDLTYQILLRLCKMVEQFNCLALKANVGKGEAIRYGINHTLNEGNNFHFYGYIDADLSVSLLDFYEMLEFMRDNPRLKFLMGIRVARLGANIDRDPIRHYLGRIFATIVSKFILKEAVYDTQCGAKLFHFSIIKDLFEKKFISKWFFDVELLLRTNIKQRIRNLEIYEYPLKNWVEVGKSKVRLVDFLMVPINLRQICKHYSNKH